MAIDEKKLVEESTWHPSTLEFETDAENYNKGWNDCNRDWIKRIEKISLENKTSDKDVPDTNVGKWIPCSERLPDEHENYIVTACDECNMIWAETVVVLAEYFEGSWLWYEGGDEYDITDMVIAWMPLPEPYKGEEKCV